MSGTHFNTSRLPIHAERLHPVPRWVSRLSETVNVETPRRMSGHRQHNDQLNYGCDRGFNPWETTADAMSREIIHESKPVENQSHGTQTAPPRTSPVVTPPFGTDDSFANGNGVPDPSKPSGPESPMSAASVKLESRHVHPSPEAKALRAKGSTASWNPISHDLQPHTPLDYAVRATNTALAVGTSALPGQSEAPGYGAVHTTAQDLGHDHEGHTHTPAHYAVRATNTALAVGSQAIPYEGYFETE